MVGFLVAMGVVIGATMYVHRRPDWVGATERATVTVSGPCANPETLSLHGSAWDSFTTVSRWWKLRGDSTHPGRIHFDTAKRATFTVVVLATR